jgi:hypothetical protein
MPRNELEAKVLDLLEAAYPVDKLLSLLSEISTPELNRLQACFTTELAAPENWITS